MPKKLTHDDQVGCGGGDGVLFVEGLPAPEAVAEQADPEVEQVPLDLCGRVGVCRECAGISEPLTVFAPLGVHPGAELNAHAGVAEPVLSVRALAERRLHRRGKVVGGLAADNQLHGQRQELLSHGVLDELRPVGLASVLSCLDPFGFIVDAAVAAGAYAALGEQDAFLADQGYAMMRLRPVEPAEQGRSVSLPRVFVQVASPSRPRGDLFPGLNSPPSHQAFAAPAHRTGAGLDQSADGSRTTRGPPCSGLTPRRSTSGTGR
ncbi:hypothetical protein [Streptomyces sp. NPDC054765]